MKKLLIGAGIIFSLGSCSSLKPLSGNDSKQVINSSKKDPKFLDDISTSKPNNTQRITYIKTVAQKKPDASNIQTIKESAPVPLSPEIENAKSLQFKYAVLMNTDVEAIQNFSLYESIDEWYGTRYRMGGTTKKGIDCSAFVQNVFIAAFGLAVPRTAREQYRVAQHISRTELQEGDLLFFNTRGGVSHVGIYLKNNKFVHASSSHGVMISDMYEDYYLRRFIGGGRILQPETNTAGIIKP